MGTKQHTGDIKVQMLSAFRGGGGGGTPSRTPINRKQIRRRMKTILIAVPILFMIVVVQTVLVNYYQSSNIIKQPPQEYRSSSSNKTAVTTLARKMKNGTSTIIVPSLEFVHITKTAGNAIEDAAAKAGISWGRCKFKRWRVTEPSPGCLPLDDPKITTTTTTTTTTPILDEKEWICSIETDAWHCPPNHFQNGKNLYNGSNTFAIVRNPYDRMISEYYYFKPWKEETPQQKSNLENMNNWIQQQLKDVKTKGSCKWGHCIPMHKYTHFKNGEPIVDHVLHFENIQSELTILMNQYGLEETIQIIQNNARNKDTDNMNIGNLSNTTICRINEWAKLDFDYFGYEMIHRNCDGT